MSVKTGEGDHWIPLVFYTTKLMKIDTNELNFQLVWVQKITLRGYSVPIQLITSSTTQDIRICDIDFINREVQFRWLQTAAIQLRDKARDIWSLDNVTVAVHINGTHERQVLSEDFEEENVSVLDKGVLHCLHQG